MDVTKARQKIRERLESKSLPKDFDLTSFTVGSPPKNTKCARCHELFSLSLSLTPGRSLIVDRENSTGFMRIAKSFGRRSGRLGLGQLITLSARSSTDSRTVIPMRCVSESLV